MSQISVFFAKKQYMYDKEFEVINIRLIYTKSKLKDLSQGSRIVFIRQFRLMTQDDVSDKLM